MLKTWLTTKELLQRPEWETTDVHDLVELILENKLPAYHQDHTSVIESIITYYKDLYSDKSMQDIIRIERVSGVFNLDKRANKLQAEIISDLIEVIPRLLWRASEVKEFEKLNGMVPHEATRGMAAQAMGTIVQKPETPAPSYSGNNQILRAAMKKIGYSDFIRIFRIDKPQDWNPSLEIRLDGVYVRNPKEYYDEGFVGSAEIAALTEHPTGNLRQPALAFPCSIKEFATFIVFYGLKGYCSRVELRALKEKCDDPHGTKPETKPDVPLQTQAAGPAPAALPGDTTIVRKAQAIAIANAVKKDFPKITANEAAKQINARLATMEFFDKDGKPLMLGYSEKHLMRIIRYLKFKPGKPGRPPEK